MEWTFMDVSSIFRTKQVSYSLILYFGICSHLLQTHDIKTLLSISLASKTPKSKECSNPLGQNISGC